MAKIRTLGPGTLTIGTGQDAPKFDTDCTKTTLTPKTDTDDSVTYLDGHEENGEQTTTWTLETTVKEDFTKDGLQAWSFKHRGETMPFLFVPNNKGTLAYKGDVLIAPIGVGGDVKKQNDQDVSFTATNVDLADYDPSNPSGAQTSVQTVAD